MIALKRCSTIMWLKILLTSIAVFQISNGNKYCFLTDSSDKALKTSKNDEGETLPIVIETSHRASHIIISFMLKIILEEFLGLDNVIIKRKSSYFNETHALNRLSGCSISGCSHDSPSSMINLEVWTSPEFEISPWQSKGYISDGGFLGPKGRYGWYLPTTTVESSWRKDKRIIDHWRSFYLPETVSQLNILADNFWDDLDSVERGIICRDQYCIQHTEIGRMNKSDHLTLFSDFPVIDDGSLHAQSIHFGYDMDIVWLKTKLTQYIHNRTQQNLASLFFNWEPNTLTYLDDYTRVFLPFCKAADDTGMNCDFETKLLRKFTWAGLKNYSPEAFSVVQHMAFTESQYKDILELFMELNPTYEDTNFDDYISTACTWLTKNRPLWENWIPKDVSSKQDLYLGAMFPLSGPQMRQQGVVPAAYIAQSIINRSTKILPDYNLVLLLSDTKCKADVAMKEFLHLLVDETKPLSGIIGLGCSNVAESIAGVSKHFDQIVVSYGAEVSLQLSDRDAYPYFFRTVPPITQNAAVYVDIIKHFEWCQVALLAEDAEEFPEYNTYLHDYFFEKDVKVHTQGTIPHQTTEESLNRHLTDIKSSGTKVIILTSFEFCARMMICIAFKKKMTPKHGFVWFLPHWYTTDWWDTDFFNNHLGEKVTCSSRKMLQSITGHMLLSSNFMADADSEIMENLTVKEWQDAYLRSLNSLELDNYRSSYASYTYDAVWLFALSFHNLLRDDPTAYQTLTSPATRGRLMGYMSNISFNGASGTVAFKGPDRTGAINIHQFKGNSFPLSLIGRYANSTLTLNTTNIQWEDDLMPGKCTEDKDAPCSIGFLRTLLGVSSDVAIIIFNLCVITVFLIVTIVTVKSRYEKKVNYTRRRMKELGLLENSTVVSLDQWEMQRDKVVLNRKLGEGAFGTVYGGQCLSEEDKWTAVAIKTLKGGASAEEKLDFLIEAETMKAFCHDNIVHLLGVCTRSEPILAVMEFMLYGDLKTFLLDRRHLVQQFYFEADEVSAKSLTKYALDIARGVSYLAENNYVHRDLACRNCLVHADRTIKLGDFGMTRQTLNKDYYRFNKKGMLPVRWMAPESLTHGVFHHYSDVWSYGIVMYEIMTFGNLPYQGMSNSEVLIYVAEGHIMELPSNCTRDMRDLLHQCWSLSERERCRMGDIIQAFVEKPLFVQPTLALPSKIYEVDGNKKCDPFRPKSPSFKYRQKISRHLFKLSSQDRMVNIKPFITESYSTKQKTGNGCLDNDSKEATRFLVESKSHQEPRYHESPKSISRINNKILAPLSKKYGSNDVSLSETRQNFLDEENGFVNEELWNQK